MANVDCNQVEVIYEYATSINEDLDRCEINDFVYKVKKIDKTINYNEKIGKGDCIERYKIAYDALITGNREPKIKYNFVEIKTILDNFDTFKFFDNFKDNDHDLLFNYITYALIKNEEFKKRLVSKLNDKIVINMIDNLLSKFQLPSINYTWLSLYIFFLIDNFNVNKDLYNSLYDAVNGKNINKKYLNIIHKQEK